MKKGTKVIEQRYFTGSQSVNYTEIYSKNDKKIKIEIKSDAYQSQSYARGSVFDGAKWQPVYNIPSSQMHTEVGLIYTNCKQKPEIAASAMAKDIAEVIEKTEKILF
jgi:hypothetical protein